MVDFLERLFTNKIQAINCATFRSKFFYYSLLIFLFGLINKSLSNAMVTLNFGTGQFVVFLGDFLGSLFLIFIIMVGQASILMFFSKWNIGPVMSCLTVPFLSLFPLLPLSYILFFVPQYRGFIWAVLYLYFVTRCTIEMRRNLCELIKMPRIWGWVLINSPIFIVWIILASGLVPFWQLS